MTLHERVIKIEAMIEVSLSLQCKILAKMDGSEPEEIHANVTNNIQEIFDEYINEGKTGG